MGTRHTLVLRSIISSGHVIYLLNPWIHFTFDWTPRNIKQLECIKYILGGADGYPHKLDSRRHVYVKR
jgi:hypothetical protein